MSDQYQNITWDNSNVYADFDDPRLNTDLENLEREILTFSSEAAKFEEAIGCPESEMTNWIEPARKLTRMSLDISENIQLISAYASFKTSVEADHKKAKEISSKTQRIWSDLAKAQTPLDLFILRSSDSFFNEFINDDRVAETKFMWVHSRKENDFLLSTREEVLATGLSVDGLHAWGKLYNEIAGNMAVEVDGEKMGLAQASSILRGPDRVARKNAWVGINNAWTTHQDSAAAVLNAINGWRNEINKTRSSKRELHYLDKACHQSRITRKTLSAMMDTAYDTRSVGQRALKGMAKKIGVDKLGPWDILAPCPAKGSDSAPISFPDAIELIAKAFDKFSPDMGEFARMMAEKRWIDSLPTPKRSPGAYCGGFGKLREPRVFMTYTGTMGNVLTLAHELGHAYHNWVMKDLPLTATRYSMTLAETASIFAETLVRDAILSECQTDEEKLNILWQDAESAGALLINIPARYEFEKMLVEERFKRNVPADDLKTLMNDAWAKWYEETLVEYDPMFWASKLHFSISSIGFYNYPYLFGYLFSLGIYAQKDKYGEKFPELYKNILRDTGTMTAEDLIKKHLDQDIESPDFWKDSISIVESSITKFEGLIR
ncbi:MAG: M3 family oligoendopeptidase [Deltaproteobacteria bacterium]|nr:MAG: M3 family oligoendopeptidase [Deltaproteobacteria bacterium]